ncbi:hypothetical protein DL96DRAFT_1799600 [Flagelloscypha sp. PMI_526]|nr:hypothetical protein DL96DRAFT_1799600 [Flagelloscypha sp. PMI_526]
MDYLRPAALPAFLDPLFDSLPEPLRHFAITFLAHSFALIMANLLPPIITLLAAYLALLSLYRTTTWTFRLVFWFIKWGGLFGILMALVGWTLGSNSLSSFVNTGTLYSIGSLVWGLLNDQSERQRGSSRPNTRSQTRSRTAPRAGERPSVWDSFDRHREWQDRRNAEAGEASSDVVQDVVDLAEKYLSRGRLAGVFDALKETMQKQDGGDREETSRSRTRSKSSR